MLPSVGLGWEGSARKAGASGYGWSLLTGTSSQPSLAPTAGSSGNRPWLRRNSSCHQLPSELSCLCVWFGMWHPVGGGDLRPQFGCHGTTWPSTAWLLKLGLSPDSMCPSTPACGKACGRRGPGASRLLPPPCEVSPSLGNRNGPMTLRMS